MASVTEQINVALKTDVPDLVPVIIKPLCCINCGVIFWITELHFNKMMNVRSHFFCPNGHINNNGEREEEDNIDISDDVFEEE